MRGPLTCFHEAARSVCTNTLTAVTARGAGTACTRTGWERRVPPARVPVRRHRGPGWSRARLVSGPRSPGSGSRAELQHLRWEPIHRKLRSTGAPAPPGAKGGGSGQSVGGMEGGGAQDTQAPAAKTRGEGEACRTDSAAPRRQAPGGQPPQPARRPPNPDLKHNPAAGLWPRGWNRVFSSRVGLCQAPPWFPRDGDGQVCAVSAGTFY